MANSACSFTLSLEGQHILNRPSHSCLKKKIICQTPPSPPCQKKSDPPPRWLTSYVSGPLFPILFSYISEKNGQSLYWHTTGLFGFYLFWWFVLCFEKKKKNLFFWSLQSSLLFIMEELAGGISLAVANDIIVTGDIFVFFFVYWILFRICKETQYII